MNFGLYGNIIGSFGILAGLAYVFAALGLYFFVNRWAKIDQEKIGKTNKGDLKNEI